MKRFWVILIILAAVGGGGYFLWQSKTTANGNGIAYHTTKIERGDIVRTVTATGSLEPVNQVTVGAQITGTISKLYADYNTKVSKGDIIAEIDPSFLQAQLQEAQANLTKAIATMNQSDREYKRSQSLIQRKLISEQELDSAKTNLDVSKASVQQAEAARNRAETNLKYATIYSPINGIVVSREIEVGQTVAASLSAPELFVIAEDLTSMQVLTYIDESDIGMIAPGQSVVFTVDAYPELSFIGQVDEIRLSSKIESNVVTYPVVIGVQNSELKLLPGMTANVTITVAERKDVLRLPSSALRYRPDSQKDENSNPAKQSDKKKPSEMSSVFILKSGIPQEEKIKPGLDNGTWTELVEGSVQEGDEVITANMKTAKKTETSGPFGMPPMGGRRR